MKYNLLVALRAVSEEQLANIALQMAEKHPTTFEKLLFDAVPPQVQQQKMVSYDVPGTSERVHLTQSQVDKLTALGKTEKVQCIKLIRELTGLMLKEAKDLCEAAFPLNQY